MNIIYYFSGGAVVALGDYWGLVAGAFTTFSLFPQVYRVYRIKSAREISLLFTMMFVCGGGLWLGYGIYLKSIPMILWNMVAILLSLLLLIGKLRWGK
jgi:MtN3 and saliva related transmembrane protein